MESEKGQIESLLMICQLVLYQQEYRNSLFLPFINHCPFNPSGLRKYFFSQLLPTLYIEITYFMNRATAVGCFVIYVQ